MFVEDLNVPDVVKRIVLDSGVSELYPPQIEAVKTGFLEGENLVLCIPTASGKTLVAELAMAKRIIEGGGKALYLVPLRALASEKYEEFQKWERAGFKVGITSSDFDSSDAWLEGYDIIVGTNEKLDSLLRHRVRWLSDVSLVVADEVHLINDGSRGPTLEVILSKLRRINKNAQFLALSATVANADEVAGWLGAKLVVSDWRPVVLKEGVYEDGFIEFGRGESMMIPNLTGEDIIDLAADTVKGGGQALVFSTSRRSAVSAAKKLYTHIKSLLPKKEISRLSDVSEEILSVGERTRISELLAKLASGGVAFHHAGLNYNHRRLVEESFRGNLLKVITATPTLAAGVNLPARRVIIQGYRRYDTKMGFLEEIPVLEYKQQAGRAGRPKYDKLGEAVLLSSSEEEKEFLMERYVLGEPERIRSKLASEPALRTHVLATIATNYARTEKGLYDFIRGTFYGYQYDPESVSGILDRILSFLFEEGFLVEEGGKLKATKFGKRVSELYIDPLSAKIIKDGLMGAPEDLVGKEVGFLHLVSATPDMPKLGWRRRDEEFVLSFVDQHEEEFLHEPPDIGSIDYEFFMLQVKVAMLLYSWIEEYSEDQIISAFKIGSGDILRIGETGKWLLYSTEEIAKLLKSSKAKKIIRELTLRVTHGIKKELVKLVSIPGIGRIRARALYNSGYKSLKSLQKAKIEDLIKVPMIGKEIAKKIKETTGGKEVTIESSKPEDLEYKGSSMSQRSVKQAKLPHFSDKNSKKTRKKENDQRKRRKRS